MFSFCLTGCRGQAQQQPPGADESLPPLQSDVTPLIAPQVDLPVQEGTVPLAYMVESYGGVRVVDENTKRTLAQTLASGRTIVSIDVNHGVDIGGTVFVAGPLPEDHRYAVFFQSGGFHPVDELRTSTERNEPTTKSYDFRKSNKNNQNEVLWPATASSSQPSTLVQPHH